MKSTRKKRPKASRSSLRKSGLRIWQARAERCLEKAVSSAGEIPALKKLCPAPDWAIEIRVVGLRAMKNLNFEARGKNQPTDILSFELPTPFKRQGMLGELVVCLPVLKRQAASMKHTEEGELLVLVVHGLLHLLGFDHEKGAPEARRMARFEAALLTGGKASQQGLIHRSRSGKE